MRKEITDKLITDLKALVFSGTSKIFGDLKKVYIDMPTTLPAGYVLPAGVTVEIIGNTSNLVKYSYDITTIDIIENSANQAEAELKIDRLSNIEDKISNYILKLPNNVENALTGIHITDTRITNGIWDYASDDRGIIVILNISCELDVVITPQLLS